MRASASFTRKKPQKRSSHFLRISNLFETLFANQSLFKSKRNETKRLTFYYFEALGCCFSNQTREKRVQPKMARATKRVSFLERRKWSDWSECSASCTKQRHRLNCDDILNINKPSFASAESAPQNSVKKRILYDADATERANKNIAPASLGAPEEEHNASPEQDSEVADSNRGDEHSNETSAEDEEADASDDSCEHLDASLTVQEVACVGNACGQSSSSHAPKTHSTSGGRVSSSKRKLAAGNSANSTSSVHQRAHADSNYHATTDLPRPANSPLFATVADSRHSDTDG